MGLSTKKTKTTSSSNQTATMTPNNPAWSENLVSGVADRIGNLGNLDPYSLVADANPLQTSAGNLSGSLGAGIQDARVAFGSGMGSATGATQSIIDGSAPQMTAASLLDGLQNYMSPYTNNVVDTTLANYDRSAGQNRAQQLLNIGGMDDTFGGSGSMAYLGNFDAANQLNRAQTEAQLRDQGFNTGSNLSNLDAGRRQDASSTNAQLQAQQNALKLQAAQQMGALAQSQANTAMGFDANQRDNATSQANIGDVLRQIQQQKLGAPIAQASAQAGLLGQLPLDLFRGQTVNSTGTSTGTSKESGAAMGDWLNYFASNARAAAQAGGGG